MNEEDQIIFTNRVIDAAEKHADLYDGDDRQDIKTDVINAFYAGVKFVNTTQTFVCHSVDIKKSASSV